jgi:hypothetical protein
MGPDDEMDNEEMCDHAGWDAMDGCGEAEML